MPCIEYVQKRFQASSLAIIDMANQIIDEYQQQGFSLTLRQLYYQFVSRDLISNTQREYKRLGGIINDARLAGLIDWYAIEDRTRALRGLSHWDNPSEIIRSAAQSYRIDKWAEQKYRPEVWIEKDALVGVIEQVCNHHDISFFSCRGYTSQSEMWAAAQRFQGYMRNGQRPYLIHLGDHDPSGKDMTRDIEDRLSLFLDTPEPFPVRRIALNWDQIEEYAPPPNPAKITDSRAHGYIAEFGKESWELDALEPSVIVDLIEEEIYAIRDLDCWKEAVKAENEGRTRLEQLAKREG